MGDGVWMHVMSSVVLRTAVGFLGFMDVEI